MAHVLYCTDPDCTSHQNPAKAKFRREQHGWEVQTLNREGQSVEETYFSEDDGSPEFICDECEEPAEWREV